MGSDKKQNSLKNASDGISSGKAAKIVRDEGLVSS